ncbi:MAG: hypothetical protein ACRDPH_08320 [Marmoricola sp.]
MVVSLGLAGCGSSSGSDGSSNLNTSAAQSCPTDTTKAFPKTRFVADVGLIAGSFHHWIWKPYKEGKFKKGADHRFFTTAKAVATAAFIGHMLKNAVSNVKASPTLCKALYKPLAKLSNKVSSLGSDIRHGHLGSLAAFNGVLAGAKTLMGRHGNPVTETFK